MRLERTCCSRSHWHSEMSAHPARGLRYSKPMVRFFFSLFCFKWHCNFACCQVWSKINLNTQKDGTISLGPCVRRGRLMSCYGDPFLEWNWIMVKRIRLGVRLKFKFTFCLLAYAWLTLCKLIDLSWYMVSWMKKSLTILPWRGIILANNTAPWCRYY